MAAAATRNKPKGAKGKAKGAKRGASFDARAYVASSIKGVRATVTDAERAAVLAGLERAKKSIEDQMENKRARPAVGTHALNIAVAVSGDVVVAEGRVSPAKEVPTFKDGDLATALLAGVAPSERSAFVRDAVARLKACQTEAATQTTLAECKEVLATVGADEARARGMFETVGGTPVNGAITGKPGVVIGGTVGQRSVRIEIDGE